MQCSQNNNCLNRGKRCLLTNSPHKYKVERERERIFLKNHTESANRYYQRAICGQKSEIIKP